MKLSRSLIFLVFVSATAYGQLEEPDVRTSDELYFLFPIKPGIRNTLSGTMGELRSTHFHTGLDIRTEGRTGLAVQASAEGYVSRVSISSRGYGNALYLTHPNGLTTVYAHLEKFTGPLAEYILKEQYRRKTAELNLYFHKDRFRVSRGDTVAFSGNSGSSQGPHLHYDIRDRYNNPINPLEYGFREILDHTPPVAEKLTIKTLDKYSRVNDQFGKAVYSLTRVGNNYVIHRPIKAYGTLGLELYAYDILDNSRFRCGINTITVEVNGQVTFTQQIDKLSFAKQRSILVHMDYSELRETGLRYHKLYVDDGNNLDFYSANNQGRLKLTEEDIKKVRITMKDTYGNVSRLDFTIQGQTPTHTTSGKNISANDLLIGNTLVITAPLKETDNTLDLFLPEKQSIPASYTLNHTSAVYLWDMNDGLPYSVNTGKKETIFNFQHRIPPNESYSFYSKAIDIDFPSESLFDTLYMQSSYSYDSVTQQEVFSIGNPEIPLRKYVSVYLKPEKDYSHHDKLAVYQVYGRNRLSYQGGAWVNGKMKFATRSFGNYTIAADTIPPQITPVRTTRHDLVFKITDERSGIKSYSCTLDGQWVLMHYDYKRSLIWSEKLDTTKDFKGSLKLVVSDNQNNKSEYIINL